MSKKSKVKKVTANGTWDTKKEPIKTFYKYSIEMENGDIGEYSSVSSSLLDIKFKEGEDVDYVYDNSRADFPKIKLSYNKSYNDNNCNTSNCSNKEIAKSVGVKAAVRLGIAQGLELTEILETAKILSDFILTDNECIIKGSKDSFLEI